MRVRTIRLDPFVAPGDTIEISDYDGRQTYFRRCELPKLLQLLKSQLKRPPSNILRCQLPEDVLKTAGGD